MRKKFANDLNFCRSYGKYLIKPCWLSIRELVINIIRKVIFSLNHSQDSNVLSFFLMKKFLYKIWYAFEIQPYVDRSQSGPTIFLIKINRSIKQSSRSRFLQSCRSNHLKINPNSTTHIFFRHLRKSHNKHRQDENAKILPEDLPLQILQFTPRESALSCPFFIKTEFLQRSILAPSRFFSTL